MKVVWICHFSSEEINDILQLKKKNYEFAPWVSNMLSGIEKSNDIELHVIAPYQYIKKTVFIEIRNIKYYFIPVGIPIIHRYYPDWCPIDIFFKYFLFKNRVKKIVERIKPDIINLIGAENAYYSTSILQFRKKYPIIITIQGFISEYVKNIKVIHRKNVTKPEIVSQNDKHRKLHGYLKTRIRVILTKIKIKHRSKIELKILKTFNHFNGELDSKNYIKNINKNIKFFKAYFPINERIINELKDEPKRYDCIFYGRFDKLKGSEDFIKIIAELKKELVNIKGVIAGIGDLETLESEIANFKCEQNITIKGFLNDQTQLFQLIKQSKIVVVPTYVDRLPLSIREAMFLNVPVIAYATGGIPHINKEAENIELVEKGDYIEMAKKVRRMLEDEEYLNIFVQRGYGYALQEFSMDINIQQIIDAYKSTIKDYLE